MNNKNFDVLIIGGSYAGLSAGMALGRALRKVLIIDSGEPCNRQTPHSHNFITQDGKTPKEISTLARQQVAEYPTVNFRDGLVLKGLKTANGYEITTDANKTFIAKKLIFATGVKDIMPDMEGFSECWGISVIHCPYCHGYEYRHKPTGILANGDQAFEMAKLVQNWTADLTIFTNGISTLTSEQTEKLRGNNIKILENKITRLKHFKGQLDQIEFNDAAPFSVSALYARPKSIQTCPIPENLGCSVSEQGFLEIDSFQKTTVSGIFACGDNVTPFRSVASAVAMGGIAGAMLNRELTDEEF